MRMPVAAVRTAFRLKRFVHRHHRHVHGSQHVGQHMVGLNLQVVGLQLDGHMAVAEVVGRTRQVKRRAMLRACRDAQHLLWRRLHAHQRAVFEHQHIATAHQGAAWQEHTQGTAVGVGRIKAAFLTHVPIEFDRGSAFDKCSGQTVAARN